jgi:cobalt transporter subunit CbtA
MIGRVLLAALLAGIAAGLFMGVIQHWRLTPLILEAERYEVAGVSHDAGATTENPAHEAEVWAPGDGLERTLFTTLTLIVIGAAYAAILAGISLLAGIPITVRNGALWGLLGFLAASLAPAAGLPPELPGMPAGDLAARQIWWIGTIIASGIAVYLTAAVRKPWAVAAAVLVAAVPHVIGAPAPVSHESTVPAGLAAAFAASSIAAAAVFWILIGSFLGLALARTAKEPHTP